MSDRETRSDPPAGPSGDGSADLAAFRAASGRDRIRTTTQQFRLTEQERHILAMLLMEKVQQLSDGTTPRFRQLAGGSDDPNLRAMRDLLDRFTR